jgi:hypothetical protein
MLVFMSLTPEQRFDPSAKSSETCTSAHIRPTTSQESGHPIVRLKERQISRSLKTQGGYTLDMFPSAVFTKVIDCADKLNLAYAPPPTNRGRRGRDFYGSSCRLRPHLAAIYWQISSGLAVEIFINKSAA